MTTRNQTTGKPIRISVADLRPTSRRVRPSAYSMSGTSLSGIAAIHEDSGRIRPRGGEIGLDPAWSEDRLLVAY